MALTPDSPDAPNEAFLREVDEDLRRDQLEGFAKTYGKWVIAAVVVFLAAVAGYLYWQDRQEKKAAAQSEELMSIYADIGNGKIEQAKKRLQPLESSDVALVRSLALLSEAAIAMNANDRDTALAKFRAVAADEDVPEPYRNLALIRATTIEFDQLKPEETVSRLQALAKPGNPWFGTAGELTAMAYLKQGQKDKAGRVFAAIAADRQVPDSIRSRAVQIAGTLGVDASAALPQPGQTGSSE
ncbi:MAG TPA: tetratricopeptide repeat protein [Sphingomicrobium sp.]|nr:tetratricopeptide repeat protein [Sphingomicrobium sp.]